MSKHAAHLLTIVVAVSAAGCAGSQEAEEASGLVAFCARHDVPRQILSPATVYSQKSDQSRPLRQLDPADWVYVLTGSDKWLRVAYVEKGEPLDCCFRAAVRKCRAGWIENTVILGHEIG